MSLIYLRLKKTIFTIFVKLLHKKLSRPLLKPSRIQHDQIKKILVISEHHRVADLLMTCPVYRALHEKYAQAELTVLYRHNLKGVLENNPHITRLLPDYIPLNLWNGLEFFKLCKKIYAKFDFAIVLPTVEQSFTADLLGYISKARYVMGTVRESTLANYGVNLFNLQVPKQDENEHIVKKNIEFLRFAGIGTDDFSENLYLTTAEFHASINNYAEEGVKPVDFIIGFEFEEKKIEHRHLIRIFVELAKYFSHYKNGKTISISMSKHNRFAEEFINALPFKPIILNEEPVRKLAGYLSHCNLIICNHLDIVHLAAGMDVPAIVLKDEQSPIYQPLTDAMIEIDISADKQFEISPSEILQFAEKLIKKYPKSDDRYLHNLDISDHVLDRYLGALDSA